METQHNIPIQCRSISTQWLYVAALISAFLVILDPLLLTCSSQAMKETPSAYLTALCCLLFAGLGIVAVWSLACERMKKHRAHRINGVARALREVEI